MEGTAPQSDHSLRDLSAPIGFLWASNQFANGLIHEFTNHATACLALIDSIEKSVPPGPVSDLAIQLGKSFRTCRSLIVQSKRIIENIFSNSTNLNEVTDFSVRLLRRVINQNVQIESQLDPTVGALRVQTKGLEMVLAALLIGAREALHGEGSIMVETRYLHLDAPCRTRLVRLPAGDYATLQITCTNDEQPDEEWEQWLSQSDSDSSAAPSSHFIRSLLTAMGAQIDIAMQPFGATLTLYFPVSAF